MKKGESRAGKYAAQRAHALRGEWEIRARPKARLFFWPLVAIGVLGIILTRSNPWAVVFGALVGAGIVGYAFLLESVPDAVHAWERGAVGERRTEDCLRPIEIQGWHVIHDVQRTASNWDHIVVGPPGVFVLETKHRRGELIVKDGLPSLWLEGAWTDDERVSMWPGQVKGAAASLKDELEAAEGERPWVEAVLVYWGDFPARVVEAQRVTYVHGDELADWLTSRPPKLTRPRQALIGAIVQDLAERGRAPHLRQGG